MFRTRRTTTMVMSVLLLIGGLLMTATGVSAIEIRNESNYPVTILFYPDVCPDGSNWCMESASVGFGRTTALLPDVPGRMHVEYVDHVRPSGRTISYSVRSLNPHVEPGMTAIIDVEYIGGRPRVNLTLIDASGAVVFNLPGVTVPLR